MTTENQICGDPKCGHERREHFEMMPQREGHNIMGCSRNDCLCKKFTPQSQEFDAESRTANQNPKSFPDSRKGIFDCGDLNIADVKIRRERRRLASEVGKIIDKKLKGTSDNSEFALGWEHGLEDLKKELGLK